MSGPTGKNMSGLTGTVSVGSSEKAQAGSPVRNYFYLRQQIDTALRFIELGIVFALPIVVAVFSKTYAFAIIATEIIAYCLGGLIADFDNWYNNRTYPEHDLLEKALPETELEIILARLVYFENKYSISLGRMYEYLDVNIVPCDNLDWIEIVSLLNQLSLHVGKHFEEDSQKGAE